MNFTNLKYFLAVADELSFSRAADKLYVTQQNLSNHISRLEEELQATLFARSPSLRLTYAGECMRDYARQLVATEQQMQLHLGDISHQRRARLRIGVTRTRGRMMLAEILPEFHRRHPHVEIDVLLGRHDTLLTALKRGDLDLTVGMRVTDHPEDSIRLHHIYSTRLCLLVPEALMPPGQSADASADIQLFAETNFLLHKDGNVLRDCCQQYFAREHISPHVILELNDLEMLHQLCASGMGVTFSFERYARKWLSVQSGGIGMSILPIANEEFSTDFVIAHSDRHYFSAAADAFIRIALESSARL